MLPVTVTLQVPYAENEQQFLVQAVQVALKAFRGLRASAPKTSEGIPSSMLERPRLEEARLVLAS